MPSLLFILVFGWMITSDVYAQYDSAKPRPQLHFTPPQGFMNDPNGFIYHKGIYHLFYQYLPPGEKAKHWGHAHSTNLLTWTHAPVALYPDSLGAIWSGSVVYDSLNTSGLGTAKNPPLIAIFTHRSQVPNKLRPVNNQMQSLAYSLDGGYTWAKYAQNPVLQKPGSKAFRDPKVFGFRGHWIMVLAVQDHVELYRSANLKEWTFLSAFGKGLGAQAGVWECPDLFMLSARNKPQWVLVVSIAKGAPAGGSGTRYFVGNFDGTHFRAYDTVTRWLDDGPDNYAGITTEDGQNNRIFIGWMNNWRYASKLPAALWKGSMTIPRKLTLEGQNHAYRVRQSLPREILDAGKIVGTKPLKTDTGIIYALPAGPFVLQHSSWPATDVKMTLYNDHQEQYAISYNARQHRFVADRRNAVGANSPMGIASADTLQMDTNATHFLLLADAGSAEILIDGKALSQQLFMKMPYTHLRIEGWAPAQMKHFTLRSLATKESIGNGR